jgi:prephenate dehydrogenase
MARRALIIGLGLIGGSAGIALRRRGWRVGFIDPNVSPENARAAGAADEAGLADPDVILLATPVDAALGVLSEPAPVTAITTSACSVMRPLRAAASRPFVAGHPLAGSHLRGLAAANAGLFEGRSWFVDAEDERVDAMIRDCGAVIERVSAIEHDEAMALTSHLPQVVSTALAALLYERKDFERFAGTGLQTFLRLAASDASVWAPVIEANRDQLKPLAERLSRLVLEIIERDPTAAFAQAQEALRALAAKPR